MTVTKRARSLTPAERSAWGVELRAAYELGATIQQLADGRQRSFGFIRQLLIDAGATMRPRGAPPVYNRTTSTRRTEAT